MTILATTFHSFIYEICFVNSKGPRKKSRPIVYCKGHHLRLAVFTLTSCIRFFKTSNLTLHAPPMLEKRAHQFLCPRRRPHYKSASLRLPLFPHWSRFLGRPTAGFDYALIDNIVGNSEGRRKISNPELDTDVFRPKGLRKNEPIILVSQYSCSKPRLEWAMAIFSVGKLLIWAVSCTAPL